MNATVRSRIRSTNTPVIEVPLAPEIAMAVRRAAAAAGLEPGQLIADILRDTFEPIYAGRGKLAAEAALGSPVVSQPSNAEEIVP